MINDIAKAKPILFSTPMVEAILTERKTMTRRVIGEDKRGEWTAANDVRNTSEHGATVPCYLHREVSVDDKSRNIMYPRYDVGDILWVRETWAPGCMGGYIYKAGHEYADRLEELKQWKPSIHMPKDAARIYLKVTDVKVERVADITEEDAIAEGMSNTLVDGAVFISAKGKFHVLWDELNAKRGYGWELNPWVWAYRFERYENQGGKVNE